MSTGEVVFRIAFIVFAGLCLSIIAASFGHPSALWLWRDVLHVIS